MADANSVQFLINNLSEFIGFHIDYFGTTRLINEKDVVLAKKLFTKLRHSPHLKDCPAIFANALSEQLTTLNSMIRKFSGNEYDDLDANDQNALTAQFQQYYSSALVNALTIYDLLSALNNVQDSDIELQKRINKLSEYLNTSETTIIAKIKTIESVINSFNEKNKDLGIVKYSYVFSKEFERYRNSSNWWLASSILFLAAIIGLLFYVANTELSDVTIKKLNSNALVTHYIIQNVVTRILIVSALFYGLAFSVKAFRANKHSSVVNKHRQSALDTFEAFVNAPSADQNTKNAVLLEATRTIFSHQTTGYDTNDKDAEVPNKIIEIIKPIGN